jgi:FkbM family methyltransferase
LLRWRRRLALRFGYPEYCRVGCWSLIDEIFGNRAPGVFFEAGAHDGWTGSNTYWLEARHGWRGVLVEPVPGLYRACRRERPRSQVFHAALVSAKHRRPEIEVECSGLVSAVTSSPMLLETRALAESYYGVKDRPTIQVPARTIDACLEAAAVDRVDFMSLDLEGSEPEALDGFDLDRWRPEWLLIECNDEPAIAERLPRYRAERRIAPRDVLFRRER